MQLFRRKSSYLPSIMLALVLIAAQWGSVLHAFQHDAGVPLTKVCPTCVAANQLGAACLDSSPAADALPPFSWSISTCSSENDSVTAPAPRQRGPPPSA